MTADPKHCDACGSKLPKGHVSLAEQDKKQRIADLLAQRKKLEEQLSGISRELVKLGYSG